MKIMVVDLVILLLHHDLALVTMLMASHNAFR